MTAAKNHKDDGEFGSSTNIQCFSFQCLLVHTPDCVWPKCCLYLQFFGPHLVFTAKSETHCFNSAIHPPHMGQMPAVLLDLCNREFWGHILTVQLFSVVQVAKICLLSMFSLNPLMFLDLYVCLR